MPLAPPHPALLAALDGRSAWALAVFALAYLLIAARRVRFLPIGRPTGALLGAVLMVMTGVLAPREAYASVDGDTIALLFGMMVLQVEFEHCGLMDAFAHRLASGGGSATRLLCGVVAGSGVLSALLVNDAVCLMATPLVVRLCRMGRLPPLPFLLALAAGSNVGGTMTLTGTPQCMIIGAYSGISYARYASVMAPTGLVLLVVTAAGLSFAFRRDLRGARPAAPPPPGPLDRGRAVRFATTFGAVLAGFFAGLPLAWVALGGACLSAMLRFGEPTETLRRVDWSLLLFFASLFVVIGGLSRAGWVEAAVGALRPALSDDPAGRPLPFAAFSLVASNLLSNVPFVLVLGDGYRAASEAFWYQLALTSTLAGNLTLVGSVANLIVAEASARDGVEVGFWRHLRVGVPLTLLTTAVGLAVLALLGFA